MNIGTALVDHAVDFSFHPTLAFFAEDNVVRDGVNDFFAAMLARCVHGFLDVGTGVESHGGETPEERFIE